MIHYNMRDNKHLFAVLFLAEHCFHLKNISHNIWASCFRIAKSHEQSFQTSLWLKHRMLPDERGLLNEFRALADFPEILQVVCPLLGRQNRLLCLRGVLQSSAPGTTISVTFQMTTANVDYLDLINPQPTKNIDTNQDFPEIDGKVLVIEAQGN